MVIFQKVKSNRKHCYAKELKKRNLNTKSKKKGKEKAKKIYTTWQWYISIKRLKNNLSHIIAFDCF